MALAYRSVKWCGSRVPPSPSTPRPCASLLPAITADGLPADGLILIGLIASPAAGTFACLWQLPPAPSPGAVAAVLTESPVKPRLVSVHQHTACASTTDGKYLVLGTGEGTVVLVTIPSLRAARSVQAHSLPVTAAVALSAVAAAPSSAGKRTRAGTPVVAVTTSADKRCLVTLLHEAPSWPTPSVLAAVVAALVLALALIAALLPLLH